MMNQETRSYLTQNMIIFIPFCYYFYAAFYALFNFDQIEFFALYWNQNTDPFSLMQSSINTWRLAIPIGYNFIQLLSITNCAFLQVMGPVQQIPLMNEWFNQVVIPACLMFMVFITLVDGYNRLLKLCGKKKAYVSGTSDTVERVTEGQFIIDKYRQDKLVTKHKNLTINDCDNQQTSTEENTNDTQESPCSNEDGKSAAKYKKIKEIKYNLRDML